MIESFNGRRRNECLNQPWFLSLDKALAVTVVWKKGYKRVRPHGALGSRTLSEFAQPLSGYAQIMAAHG
jgi:putative transposase